METKTQLIPADAPGAIDRAAAYVRHGRLVALPTDTVYGVGCAAFDEAAIHRLYAVKQRPYHKAIPILLADLADLTAVTTHVSPLAQALIQRYWPGPLTIILPKHPALPAVISPNEGIAVRIPDQAVARALIRVAGGAMAVTSANRSGQPPAQTAVQAAAYLGDGVTAILDDGPAPMGQASTIVACTGDDLHLIRSGPLSWAEIQSLTEAQTIL
ncbi:MAG TPA: threonylcarbamoyl-AMP synthase [Anaerolineae bacterium]|nr:threonylcarbamoyl-AMP synthase [Anaerolineae bacterium]